MSMERSRGRAGGADEKLCKNVVTSENIREHLLTSWGRSCELSFLNWSRNPVRTLKLINECCSSSTILKLSQSMTHFNVVNFVQFIPVHMCVCALARCTSSWRKLLTTDRSLRRNATSVRHAVTVFSDCPLQVTTVSPRKPAQVYTLFLRFNGHFSTWTWVSRFIGAKDDGSGGDDWSYKTCKAPVKLSQPTNQHPTFYRPDALPVAQPTVLKHWRDIREFSSWSWNNDVYVMNKNVILVLWLHFAHGSIWTPILYWWGRQSCKYFLLPDLVAANCASSNGFLCNLLHYLCIFFS